MERSEKQLKSFIDFTKKWEGGLSNHKEDSASSFTNPIPWQGKLGWHTNVGITWAAWVKHFGESKESAIDFYKMPQDKWFKVFKEGYWDKVRADDFDSFSVAVYVTGMAWGSGPKVAIKTLQQAVNNVSNAGIKVDGVVGPNTIRATNACNEVELFNELLRLREKFFRSIAKPGSKNEKFLKGWLNRLEDYRNTFHPDKLKDA